jgi:outer membrane lipoprotein-sorting protein
MGSEAPSTTYILDGKAYKYEMTFNGQQIQQCITDKGSWSINPMMGQATATALTDEQVKANQSQLQVGGPFYNYADKGSKVDLIGKDTSEGYNCYKLKLTPKAAGTETTFYIDANT